MKKVALIYGSWLAAPTGASKVVNSLVENDGFREHGIDIISYSMDDIAPRNYSGKQKTNKSLIHYIKIILNTLSQYCSIIAFLSIYITYMRHAKAIVRYFTYNSNNIDTIFIHDMYTCYYFLKSHYKYKKLVLVLHTNGEPLKMEKCYFKSLNAKGNFGMNILHRMYKNCIRQATDICFVANSPAETFKKCNPDIEHSKVHYIYNGLPDATFVREKPLNDLKEIVCVGSVTERKGQRMLIDAICRVAKEKTPDFHVTILGDGVIRNELEQKIKDNNLSSVVEFPGFTDNVNEYLINSDIFILPSKDEGFPMSILEAMRISLPIISTNIAGIPEMLHNGYNGILIEPNENDIYAVMRNLNVYDWKQMGCNSRRLFIDKFLINKMVKDYCDILK